MSPSQTKGVPPCNGLLCAYTYMYVLYIYALISITVGENTRNLIISRTPSPSYSLSSKTLKFVLTKEFTCLQVDTYSWCITKRCKYTPGSCFGHKSDCCIQDYKGNTRRFSKEERLCNTWNITIPKGHCCHNNLCLRRNPIIQDRTPQFIVQASVICWKHIKSKKTWLPETPSRIKE